MKDRQQDQPLGQFAGQLLTEVTQDRDILQHFADGVGSGSNVLKEFTAWLGEKASRVKLGAGAAGEFGTFEALEFLALGVQGKLSLWHALRVAAVSDARLSGLDFERLIGKQPGDYPIWILEGTAPAFIREEGQFYEGGPIWRIEQISPTFSR